uniref:DNA-3-methyladenine glycosylase n=1 Tax=Sus scrofa TaxID=9823 RepID=A0A4X1UM86_PIG
MQNSIPPPRPGRAGPARPPPGGLGQISLSFPPGGRQERGNGGSEHRKAGKGTHCLGRMALSRRMGQKKQRLLTAKRHQAPPDGAQISSSKEPRMAPPMTPGPQRSIYFSSLKGHPARLGSEFFDQPAVPLARAFLGQVLVRHLGDGTELRGRIVETETPRNRGMFMRPGTLYVYLIYGMYFCMNVSSRGDGACVLLRALEPLGGLEAMRQLRHTVRKGAASRALKDRELCSGPSKLCQALAIDKSFDQRDLATDEAVWLERGPSGSGEPAVVAAARVGIGHAGEWAQKPLRFYIQGSPWVSVVDRAAERDAQAGHRPAHEEF